jgi:hypothetical protein
MAIRPEPDNTETSIGDLVASIKEDLTGLVRGEVELAKAEMRDEARSAAFGGGMIAVAALLGFLASILLSVGLVYAVDALGLTRGWSYVVVGGFYIVCAGAFGWIAKSQFGRVNGPSRAIASTQRAVKALRPRSRA